MNIKFTNEDIDRKLYGRNIKRLDNYISNKTPIKFQCLNEECNHIWKARSIDILNKMSGCPKCAGVLKLTNYDIDEKLNGRNIKRLDNYINALTKIKFQCLILDCNFVWETAPTT